MMVIRHLPVSSCPCPRLCLPLPSHTSLPQPLSPPLPHVPLRAGNLRSRLNDLNNTVTEIRFLYHKIPITKFNVVPIVLIIVSARPRGAAV